MRYRDTAGNHRSAPLLILALTAALLTSTPAKGQTEGLGQDSIRVGRFDMGKMWTFENAPMAYFTDTYGFNADQDWFDGARMAALRIPGCSAAFVSPNGLVVTNHHCVRGSALIRVTRDGESILDDGFYAPTLSDERPIPDYYVDQLIAAEDVSDEVFAATDAAGNDDERQILRREVISRIQERVAGLHQGGEGRVRVEVTPLYNGGRYSAYTYRRYTDVRLVAAVELKMGHFGGDGDNFTYPRYALDFAFLRVHGSDGEPLETDHYFSWGVEGVEEKDVVFVIGNPGATNRLNTVSQLAFQRDFSVAVNKAFQGSRLSAMRDFYSAHPEEGEAMGLRTRILSLSNSFKANTGRLEALNDPMIMARKAAGERLFLEALAGDVDLQRRFGDLLRQVDAIQEQKTRVGAELGAFASLGRATTESSLLLRGLAAADLVAAVQMSAAPDSLEAIKGRILAFEDGPRELEEAFLRERLEDFAHYLGEDHPVTRAALAGRSIEGAVENLMSRSVLSSRERALQALEGSGIPEGDPGVALAQAILPVYAAFSRTYDPLVAREQALAAELGRARYAIYGADVPPDGSRSPRITDGVVTPYEYNGTLAPVYTTFFGLYDHFYSYGSGTDWDLADRWLPAPPDLDLATPLNFISTADTYGGNSGSPAVTPELKIVGLNFDRNIEGLSRDFILLPERGRNIMVDVRAIQEAMDKVYDADRIVQEVLTHQLFRTEAEADAATRGGR